MPLFVCRKKRVRKRERKRRGRVIWKVNNQLRTSFGQSVEPPSSPSPTKAVMGHQQQLAGVSNDTAITSIVRIKGERERRTSCTRPIGEQIGIQIQVKESINTSPIWSEHFNSFHWFEQIKLTIIQVHWMKNPSNLTKHGLKASNKQNKWNENKSSKCSIGRH